jgi:hypothetical protein
MFVMLIAVLVSKEIMAVTVLAWLLVKNLIFMIRFDSIAKLRWHGYMFDQFHQHEHFFTTRIAGVSISGLVNIRGVFIAKFYELKNIYKGVLSRLSY